MTFKLADNEKWIAGYEGSYSVDTEGNVWSFMYGRKRKLSVSTNLQGYVKVGLSQGGKRKHPTIHRLVAETFIPNIQNKPQVNHIDGDKKNNNVTNLEWCSAKGNISHAYGSGLMEKGTTKVVRVDNYGTERIYNSMSEASIENNVSVSSISRCCRGISKTAGGYMWRYLSDKPANRRRASRRVSTVINGEVLIYNSAHEAARVTGICRESICRCCCGQYRTAGGYEWRYVE